MARIVNLHYDLWWQLEMGSTATKLLQATATNGTYLFVAMVVNVNLYYKALVAVDHFVVEATMACSGGLNSDTPLFGGLRHYGACLGSDYRKTRSFYV